MVKMQYIKVRSADLLIVCGSTDDDNRLAENDQKGQDHVKTKSDGQ